MIHYWDTPLALGIGERPLSAEMVEGYVKYADSDAIVLPPAILEELSQSEQSVKALAGLSYVGFGGGDLAKEAGDRLVDGGVTLLNVISSTEYVSLPPQNWMRSADD
jgi:hypothetical protein